MKMRAGVFVPIFSMSSLFFRYVVQLPVNSLPGCDERLHCFLGGHLNGLGSFVASQVVKSFTMVSSLLGSLLMNS